MFSNILRQVHMDPVDKLEESFERSFFRYSLPNLHKVVVRRLVFGHWPRYSRYMPHWYLNIDTIDYVYESLVHRRHYTMTNLTSRNMNNLLKKNKHHRIKYISVISWEWYYWNNYWLLILTVEQDPSHYLFAYIDRWNSYFLAKQIRSMDRWGRFSSIAFFLFDIQHRVCYLFHNSHNHTIKNMNSLPHSMHTAIDINIAVSMVKLDTN